MAVLRYDPIIRCFLLPPSSPNVPFSLGLKLPPPSHGAPIRTLSLALDPIAESAEYPYPPMPATAVTPPWVTHPPLHAHTHASRPVHPIHPGAHRHRHRPPHGVLLRPGPARPRCRGASACRRRRCDIGCELVLHSLGKLGRSACGADAGDAGCSSADADPQAPVPALEVAPELLAVDQRLPRGESRNCADDTPPPPATLLPTSKGRTLRLRSRVMKVVYNNVVVRRPARPYNPAAITKHERGRTRRVCSFSMALGAAHAVPMCGVWTAVVPMRALRRQCRRSTWLRSWSLWIRVNAGRVEEALGIKHTAPAWDWIGQYVFVISIPSNTEIHQARAVPGIARTSVSLRIHKYMS
ncbi:hypothetical protein C8R44DRAFT_893591 [Mycena epipterygia]|nr:hypothetical protein C8R44DRAFT_893591 [Mycena epipterygia]